MKTTNITPAKKFVPQEVNTIKTSPDVKLPEKQSLKAAGHDLYAHKIEQVSDNLVIVKLGLKFQPMSNFTKIIFVPRSSFTKTNWIMQNSPSQGDPDFTGEYQLRFRAIPTGVNYKAAFLNLFRRAKRPTLTYDPFPYKIGDRCAQMFIERIFKFNFNEVDSFQQTKRGSGGFGSTGV